MRAIEAARREAVDFAKQPTADRVLGADPYRVAAWGDDFVGVLRGASEVALVSPVGAVIASATAPAEPTGLSVVGDDVWVSGRAEPVVARYQRGPSGLVAAGRWPVPGAVMLRDLVATERALYVVDEIDDALWVGLFDDKEEGPSEWMRQPSCAGPIGVALAGRDLVMRCLFDHRVVVRPLGADGVPEVARDQVIEHDGPIWSAVPAPGNEPGWLALGGVEDHPLVRDEGYFGHIDSFLYLYRLSPDGAERRAALNLSAYGVITPKAMVWRDADELLVTGYGGERAVVVTVSPQGTLRVRASLVWPPGTHDLVLHEAGVLAADPLLDGWLVARRDDEPAVVPVDGPRQVPDPTDARLGEVMVFTGLMAPFNSSAGPHSRFACETCHFEGGVDGRVHHTGRGHVRAATKPLFGLFNNKPHFTRALDKDLTRVAHAEFRVAGAGSGHHPWFTVDVASRPWLRDVVGSTEPLGPARLRRAVLRFLMGLSHRMNPRRGGRSRFDDLERRGADLFEQRCVSCHAPRLSTDDPDSEVTRDRWEALVMSPAAPLVWASEAYRKTGVEPLVHPKGARTSSLRRLELKRPYFTNGSARRLPDVLSAAGWQGEAFFHARAPDASERLSEDEQVALLAFLRLL
jgi:hypothetical protein